MTGQRLIVLDGIRGFGAVIILFYHLSAGVLFPYGWLAVDLFFLLSGFVLMHAYGEKLVCTMRLDAFVIRRFIRLYPLFAIGTSLGLVEYWRGPSALRPYVHEILMIPGVRGPLFVLNIPAWSLFYEIAINVVFGFMLTRGVRIVWMFAVGAASLVTYRIFGGPGFHLYDGWSNYCWWIGPIRVLFSFPLGVLMYRFLRTRSFPSINGWWLIVAIMALAAVPGSVVPGLHYVPIGHEASITLAAVGLLFPVVIGLGAFAAVDPMSAKIFNWLGTISFALYATHHPLFTLVQRIVPNTYPVTTMVFEAVLCLAVAHGLAFRVEPPIRKWLTTVAGDLLQRRQVESEASAASIR